MKKLFNSKYPIVCAPMNGVSDLNLALACYSAGIVPSFVPYNYKDFKDFFVALAEYKLKTSGDVIVALRLNEVIDDRLHNKLMKLGITHIELLEFRESLLTTDAINKIKLIRNSGVKVILKILSHSDISPYADIIDAVTIKGAEAAGRSSVGIDLIEEIKTILSMYHNIDIIASGGVKNSADIALLLSEGVCAVGIGTMFALSLESCISKEVKDKLLLATSKDITRLESGGQQRAVVFDEQSGDDFNNTNGLYAGLQTGTTGHIFIGNAIDTITEIKSVQEIVDYLIA